MSNQPEPTHIDSWQAAEHNAAAWMRYWGHGDARITGGSNDGGIDVWATSALAQVKFEAAQVGAPAVQRLVGAAAHDIHKQLYFFSGAGYSQQAIAYADSMGVALVKYDLAGRTTPANATAVTGSVPLTHLPRDAGRVAPPPSLSNHSQPVPPSWPPPDPQAGYPTLSTPAQRSYWADSSNPAPEQRPSGLDAHLEDLHLAGVSRRERAIIEAGMTFPHEEARRWARQRQLQNQSLKSGGWWKQNLTFVVAALLFMSALGALIGDAENPATPAARIVQALMTSAMAAVLVYVGRRRKIKLHQVAATPLEWVATNENMPREAKVVILGIKGVLPGQALTKKAFKAICAGLPTMVPGLDRVTASTLLESLTGRPRG